MILETLYIVPTAKLAHDWNNRLPETQRAVSYESQKMGLRAKVVVVVRSHSHSRVEQNWLLRAMEDAHHCLTPDGVLLDA